MADSVSPDYRKPKGFLVHLAGHILLFDKRPAPDYNASAGMRLLAIRYRGGGTSARRRERALPGGAVGDSRSSLPGLRALAGSLRGEAEVPADRVLSVAR